MSHYPHLYPKYRNSNTFQPLFYLIVKSFKLCKICTLFWENRYNKITYKICYVPSVPLAKLQSWLDTNPLCIRICFLYLDRVPILLEFRSDLQLKSLQLWIHRNFIYLMKWIVSFVDFKWKSLNRKYQSFHFLKLMELANSWFWGFLLSDRITEVVWNWATLRAVSLHFMII